MEIERGDGKCRAPWVRAEIVNTFTLAETLVSARALVRYDIANAPVKELRVARPGGIQERRNSGATSGAANRTAAYGAWSCKTRCTEFIL